MASAKTASASPAGPGDIRKASISHEELTPIVLSQLQTASKQKEESRKHKRGSNHGNNQRQQQQQQQQSQAVVVDSGSESCGEETRMRTAEAFMSGIQSALQDVSSSDAPTAMTSNIHPAGAAAGAAALEQAGLSRELVSEVDVVLSKLKSSVNQGDPNLIPLITTLQASLKATVGGRENNNNNNNNNKNKPDIRNIPNQLKLSQSKSNSLNSPTTTPSTPGSSHKEWMRDPFGSLPKRPQAEGDGKQDFEPVLAKTFEPAVKASKEDEESEDVDKKNEAASMEIADQPEDDGASKIPWKVRAARKRQMKHHTTGMTKDEFAQIKKSLQESAKKCTYLI